MNILFVHTSPFENCGGIGRVTEINSLNFIELGHNVNFLILKKGIKKKSFGIQEYYLPEDDLTAKCNREFLFSFLDDGKIDIIINQSGFNTMSLQLLHSSRTSIVKIITCYHGALKSIFEHYDIILKGNTTNRLFLTLFKFPFITKILRFNYVRKMKRDAKFILNYSDRLVFLSNGYISEMESYLRISDISKVTYVHNPVKYVTNSKRDVSKGKIILFVGRINFSEKQCNLLPIIWDAISKRHNDVKYLI